MLILIISITSILTFMITMLIFFKIMEEYGNRVKNSFKIDNYKITIRNVGKTEREILDENFDKMCEEDR